MAREKDLGFFTGIKAQGIPLIAGLVSFTLLVENVMNEVESFFAVNEKCGTYLFIFLYFLFPVGLILSWVVWFNSNEGLKKYYRTRGAPSQRYLYWTVRLILPAFVLLLCIFLCVSSATFLIASCFCLAVISFYTMRIVLRNNHGRKENQFGLEFRQATIQFGLVFVSLLGLWSIYFYRQITSDLSKFNKTWIQEQKGGSLIGGHIDDASKVRADLKHYSSAVTDLSKKFPGFPNIDSAFYKKLLVLSDTAEYGSDAIVSSLKAEHDVLVLRWRHTSKRIDSVAEVMKTHALKKLPANQDFMDLLHIEKSALMYYDCRVINSRIQYVKFLYTDAYKESSAKWLQDVQFKGLLLFVLMALFLTCVWYDAYTLNLLRDGDQDFSEIDSARISIYLLFLLTIPFFKPIEAKDIELDKPFISLTEEFGEMSRGTGETAITPAPADTAVLENLHRALRRIDNYQKKFLKKERRKQ